MEAPDIRMLIAKQVISLEVTKGHLKWKVSDLARQTKVSRPLIYYHFGKTKAEIVDQCMDFVVDEYYGFTPERVELVRQGKLYESLRLTRQLHLEFPALTLFYQKWRSQPSPMREKFIKVERRYQDKLRRNYPSLSKTQVTAFHALLHGLVSAPFLDEEGLREGYAMLGTILASHPERIVK